MARDSLVALSPQTLNRLLRRKQISVAEFRCLDASTKQQVRQLFLNAAADQLNGAISPPARED